MAYDNTAYDFSLFERYDDYGTSAPVLEPEVKPEAARKKVKKTKTVASPVSSQQRQATWQSLRNVGKVLISVFFVFSVISAAIYLNVTLDETAAQIASVNSAISEAKSENTRLNSTLEAMVSIDKVEDYAVNVLGMVKLENYKINYLDSSETNRVVISGGKTYGTDGTFSAKIKNILSYIF